MMKFLIHRTSTDEISKKQPCDEAYKDKFVYNNYKGQIEVEAWFVDINSIEELIALYDKYDELIIRKSIHNDEVRAIEIYDDYRE